ncbi:hypothetical protein BC834DRAFT_248877 [Gloeopeniophorella convolvens]|nr:hypothetical protein BC834DRAFT_248877 [Gloeopeniophorella convolvens]
MVLILPRRWPMAPYNLPSLLVSILAHRSTSVESTMRALPLLPVLLLILSCLSLSTAALVAPLGSELIQLRGDRHKRFCLMWGCRDRVVPGWMETNTIPSATQQAASSAAAASPTTADTPPSDAPSADGSEPASEPSTVVDGLQADSKSANAGVALTSRDPLLFSIVASLIAVFLAC